MAFQENLMLLYACFRFSEVMDQMFFTVRGAVQGSFRATLGVAFVFVNVVLGLEMTPPPPPPPRFFFLRCQSRLSRFLRLHLRPLIIHNYNVRIA